MDLLIHWLLGGQMVPSIPVFNTMFLYTMEENMTTNKSKEKATKKEVRGGLMTLAANSTPNRFNVKFDSDGSGPCVVLMVERDKGEDSNGKVPFTDWEQKPAKFMGWRTIYLHVPDGYLDAFYDSEGNYKITADA